MPGKGAPIRVLAILFVFAASAAFGQNTATIQGTVTTALGGTPVHNASVRITQLNRSLETDDHGHYEFRDVPAGTYDVVAHVLSIVDEKKSVQVAAGQTLTLDFQLKLTPLRQEVTVTASGREQVAFEAFQAVTSLETFDLPIRAAPSLGEVLENEVGIAKRSFGPGSSRPVIRGFDGDRVLILQDGMPTGTLSSQSGDHGEPINVTMLERLEVVKGPSALLYGSNGLGGVVNAVTRHHLIHEHPHPGLTGYVTGYAGSANNIGGGSGGFEYGRKEWLFSAKGGGQRTGDYSTPAGQVENSATRTSDTMVGLSHFGERMPVSLTYSFNEGRYGIPFAHDIIHAGEPDSAEEDHEEVDLKFRRHNTRFSWGLRDLGSVLDSFRLSLNYSDWNHRELENEVVGTRFSNRQFVYRGDFEQKKRGALSGRFGISGLHRAFKAVGEESLAPPVDEDEVAAFALQEVDLKPLRLQFVGRVDHSSYDPVGARPRSFTGFAGAAGAQMPLWTGGAFVANYTHSFRAPSLEELYNFGPHLGNLTFEMGNDDLNREAGDGIELSVRHSAERLRAEFNFFYYGFRDYVFLAPTGERTEGLIAARYSQGDSRFIGTEASVSVGAHPSLWMNLGFDTVDAELTATGTPLPRIPPMRGRLGLDARYRALSVRPEVTLVRAQRDIFPTETPTPGYAVFDVSASWTIAQQHVAHQFTLTAFNLTNRLYRNHLSFIKELAPEVGRGIRLTYTARLF